MPAQSFRTSNVTDISKLLFLSKRKHFENCKRPNFKMDAPGFEPSALSIRLMIYWHINPLSHYGSVEKFSLLGPVLVNFEVVLFSKLFCYVTKK